MHREVFSLPGAAVVVAKYLVGLGHGGVLADRLVYEADRPAASRFTCL